MPVIKVREKTEQPRTVATGQSNAVVIPLFVTGILSGSQKIYQKGDVNFDGEVDIADAALVQSAAARLLTFDEFTKKIADINNDGEITTSDAMMITRVAAGLSDKKELGTYTATESDIVEITNFKCKLYRSSEKFVEDYKDLVIKAYIEDEDSVKTVILDNSYYEIIDLLDVGMEVYIEPICLTDPTVLPASTTKELNVLLEGFFDFPSDMTAVDKEKYRMGKLGIPKFNLKVSEKDFYKALDRLISEDGIYDKFKDKTRFNFKFLTTGAHANAYYVSSNTDPWDGAYSKMIQLCASLEEVNKYSGRGDCLALIDFEGDLRTNTATSIYDAMKTISIPKNQQKGNDGEIKEYFKFASCTFPWVIRSESSLIELPGSYAYLLAFGRSINGINERLKKYPDYYAVAGYNRGYVGSEVECTPVEELGEIDMHNLQCDTFSTKISDGENDYRIVINPIIKTSDGNFTIWGNRTMLAAPKDDNGVQNSDAVKDCNYFLNVRQLVCDIKKECYFASARVTFDPNDDVTWFNFKTWVNPLLDSMVSNRGLEWYSWKKLDSDVKGQIKAQLTIKPIEAVESFDITVYIKNTNEE